jgi:formate-dependent nitrite reductase membrane component NrfD
MDTDVLITVGILLVVLSCPSLLAAWVEQRVPRLGAVMVVAGLGMIVAAVVTKPGLYSPSDVPKVMLGVVARIIN